MNSSLASSRSAVRHADVRHSLTNPAECQWVGRTQRLWQRRAAAASRRVGAPPSAERSRRTLARVWLDSPRSRSGHPSGLRYSGPGLGPCLSGRIPTRLTTFFNYSNRTVRAETETLRRELRLEPDLDVRRVLIASLDLDESAYPDTHKHLVARTIRIAREHPDDYIRHRVQLQLGETRVAYPLPAREPKPGS